MIFILNTHNTELVKLRLGKIHMTFSQNPTKGTESKAIQVSQMPRINWRPQTAAPGIL